MLGAALRQRRQETYLQIPDFRQRPADMLFKFAVNDIQVRRVFQNHDPLADIA
ncbi:MAG: hypothetical protein ACLP2P_12425 [Desulfobaccales bacterium]